MKPQKKLEHCAESLSRIIEDTSVPRNIRRAADEARSKLISKEGTPTIRASSAISILDEVSNDPNIPVHARTLVWSIMSELETVTD